MSTNLIKCSICQKLKKASNYSNSQLKKKKNQRKCNICSKLSKKALRKLKPNISSKKGNVKKIINKQEKLDTKIKNLPFCGSYDTLIALQFSKTEFIVASHFNDKLFSISTTTGNPTLLGSFPIHLTPPTKVLGVPITLLK